MHIGGKKMRKIIALLLAMMMVFAFTACGGSSEEAETARLLSSADAETVTMLKRLQQVKLW